jgi:hypothetical protein
MNSFLLFVFLIASSTSADYFRVEKSQIGSSEIMSYSSSGNILMESTFTPEAQQRMHSIALPNNGILTLVYKNDKFSYRLNRNSGNSLITEYKIQKNEISKVMIIHGLNDLFHSAYEFTEKSVSPISNELFQKLKNKAWGKTEDILVEYYAGI